MSRCNSTTVGEKTVSDLAAGFSLCLYLLSKFHKLSKNNFFYIH